MILLGFGRIWQEILLGYTGIRSQWENSGFSDHQA
jgi:hypothetical protein